MQKQSSCVGDRIFGRKIKGEEKQCGTEGPAKKEKKDFSSHAGGLCGGRVLKTTWRRLSHVTGCALPAKKAAARGPLKLTK